MQGTKMRLGAPFFIPVDPGMPTVMWGMGGAAMEIVQQPERITLLSELDAGDPLDRALAPAAGAALRARLAACTQSVERSIENRHDDLFLDAGAAAVLFESRCRAMPGRARDYMTFVRAEMYPVMREAQANGTFAGLCVTTSVQGGEPGIITQLDQPILRRLPELSFSSGAAPR